MITYMLLALALRGINIYLVYLYARFFYKNFLESLVIAWLGVFGLQNVLMLILSSFNQLNTMGVVLGMIVLAIIFGILCKEKKLDIIKKSFQVTCNFNIESVVVIIIFVSLIIGLSIRPLFYYDTTEDALTQGMTKLAFFQQHNSLFVRYDTLTINTFSNEWLGELNGLYYLLLTGTDRAVAYGNVEIFLFLVVAYLYCIKEYGYKGKHILTYTILLCSLPVITGISMTIKTDLIAIALLPLTVALLSRYYTEETPELLFAGIMSLGATAGSKISVLPAAGLLLIALIVYYFKNAKKRYVVPVIFGAVSFLVFCSRYIINLIQYGNPFQRALNEKAIFSFEHIKKSLIGICEEFNEVPELIRTLPKCSSWNWLVNKGTGYAGYVLIVIIIIALIIIVKSNNNRNMIRLCYISIPVFFAFLFFICSAEWYRWSFRYVAPYIVVLLIACIGKLEKFEREYIKSAKVLTFLMLGISIMNIMSIFRWGQAFPYTIKESYSMTSTEKKMKCLSIPKAQDLMNIPGLLEIFSNGGRGLVYDTFSYPYYQFFGDNNCVSIDLAYDEDCLIKYANDRNYDFYVIATTLEDTENYQIAKEYFAENGFDAYQTTSGLIFMRN